MAGPNVEVPFVPPLLTAEEWAAKQAAEQVEANAALVRNPFEVKDSEYESEILTPDEVANIRDEVARFDDGPEPGVDEPIDYELADVATALVATSDTLDEMFKAMLLAARQNADDATKLLAPSIGREYTRMTLIMESLRVMLADEDTADTLGPVAVGIIDHITSEVQAWLDGTRVPFGTDHLPPAE